MTTHSAGTPDPATPLPAHRRRLRGDAANMANPTPEEVVPASPETPTAHEVPLPPSFPPSDGVRAMPPRPEVAGGAAPTGRGAATKGHGAAPHSKATKPVKGGWLRESVTVMVCALVLSILIKTFLAQAFYIPSGSMENTLAVGDRVMVNKLAPGPFDLDRGDIVVFVDPGGWLGDLPPDARPEWQQTMTEVLTFVGLLPQDAGHHLIKRLIGLPGDTVACCNDAGQLTVNGQAIEEPYIKPGTDPSDVEFETTVAPDKIWVMGDNRSNSEDSRAHMGQPGGGMVPIKNVVGRAFVVLWPAERIKLLNNPETTFASVPEPAL
ncbi:signal peptidase I [Georgenia yuyongxinii]|nr:signal peptidase I [Georgenia yuyongxinii]